ncbi:MAG TPA: DUF2802 domain-containing protein [Steroidobacteraceae bacterium]|jgi:hypothetical protein
MFEILPNPSLETLMLVGRAVLLVGAFGVFALAFIRWRRTDERNDAHLLEQLDRSFAEVRSLHETVAVMSARLEAMSERTEMDARLAPAGMVSSQRGYDVATRLARNGAGIDELVGSCGVTRHEAELLMRLHGGKGRDVAPSAAASTARARAPASTPEQIASDPTAVTWPVVPPSAAPAPKQNPVRKRGSLLSVVG